MSTPIEAVFYIHGVSNDLRGRSHMSQYEAFHNAVAKRNPAWPTKCGGAEWGWNHTAGSPKQDEHADRCPAAARKPRHARDRSAGRFHPQPARIVINSFRSLFLHGFGDVFYYVSEDGKAWIATGSFSRTRSLVRRRSGWIRSSSC